MKKIYIFCDGGLGNRLNSLIGGLIASEIISATPIVYWPINNWCGCKLDDLFDVNIEIRTDNVHSLFLQDNKHYIIHENQTTINLNNTYTHSYDSLVALKNVSDNIVYYHNKIPSYFSLLQINSNMKKLKIKKHILDRCLKFCIEKNIDTRTKGIHLRKTDHGRQLDCDSIFDQIQKERKTKFFVCSDDEATEARFNTLKNVHVFPKTSYVEKLVDGDWHTTITDTDGRIFSYNVNRSSQSVIEAFVDMLILSRTNISVRNKSSFLGWAKLYTNFVNLSW